MKEPLEVIVGCELASVIFVRDYIQLDFDGPRLTILGDFELAVGELRISSGSPGYRDALCEAIDDRVTSAASSEDAIRIEFAGGLRFEMPLRQESLQCPEVAYLMSDSGPTCVWQNQ
jgi:hypothetical protein